MDNPQKTSFVPKKSLIQGRPTANSMGLAAIVGFIILGASLVLFAGVFGYRWFLEQSINRPCDASGGDRGCGLVESLNRGQRELDVDKVTRLANLDAKMKAAQGIITGHISFRPFLELLENNTLHTVRFKGLEFSRGGVIKLKGVARGYEDIAVQAAALRDTGQITDALFSNFKVEENDDVAFDLELTINQNLLRYQPNNN